MSLHYPPVCRVISVFFKILAKFSENQTLDPVMTRTSSLAYSCRGALFCALLALLSMPSTAQQEWAYHEPQHLDHSHIITHTDWGTERVIAAVSHTDLGTGTGTSSSATPLGSSVIIRQKEDGSLFWETKLAAGFMLRISDMKVVPGTSGEVIAAVGHIRYSNTGTFSDRGLMLMLDANTGALIDEMVVEDTNPQIPFDSRLLSLDFFEYQDQMHVACVGWSGDVTSTGVGHQGLYLDALIGPSGFSLVGSIEFDSPDGGSDYDFLGKVVNEGAGMVVIGSTNQYGVNSINEQGALVARIHYDGTYDWGQSYWEAFGTTSDDGVIAADLLAIPDRPLLLALNHLKGQKFSLSTIRPTDGLVYDTYAVDVDPATSLSQIIKAFDLEAHGPDFGFVLGGYLHEHNWSDAAGSYLGNIPFRMRGTVGSISPILSDMQAFRVPAKAAGETVNNWAYAPFPDDRWQPFVYHPEMLALEAGNDPNIDYVLTGYREREVITDRFDLDIIPTDAGGTTGPCEVIDISPIIIGDSIATFSIPGPSDRSLTLNPVFLDPMSVNLDTLDCGQLSFPPCILPIGINAATDCLDADPIAFGGMDPAFIHYTWDFGDGTAPLTGTNLQNPAAHTYAAAGTYTITLTATCTFSAATVVHSTDVTVADCGDDCTPDNDLEAALNMYTSSFCSIEYGLIGSVTPVPGADIAWTLNGSALPAADGQWNPSVIGSVEDVEAAYDSGSYSGELCATVTCPDGSSNTQCQSFTLTVEAPDYGLDFWLFCGNGCFGMSGTRSAVSLDMALWDLDEAQYDAEVHFSDGTSFVLNLNNPQSIIKCFPYVPFFKSACLRIYEEGGLAAGDAPCYEVCESDACITVETIPPHLFEQVAPTLGLNPASCTVTATPIPDEVESEVSLMAFDTQYPGGGSLAEFLDAFLDGETFANQVMSSSTASGDYTPAALGEGSGSSSCYQVLEATVSHPVVLHIPDENGGQLFHAGQPVGPEFVDANPSAVVLSDPRLSLVGALLTDGPVNILAQANQQPQVAFDGIHHAGGYRRPARREPHHGDQELHCGGRRLRRHAAQGAARGRRGSRGGLQGGRRRAVQGARPERCAHIC